MVVKDKSRLPYNEGWKAWIEETKSIIRGHEWHFLRSQVNAHLNKHGLDVGDREAYLHKAVCQQLARDNRGGQCIGPYKLSSAQVKDKAYESDPRRPANLRRGKPGYDGFAWACWSLAAADGKLDAHYANQLVARIGCGSCRSHATRYLMEHKIPEGGPAQFIWVNAFHNSVNTAIGKPIVSLAQAKQIWSVP